MKKQDKDLHYQRLKIKLKQWDLFPLNWELSREFKRININKRVLSIKRVKNLKKSWIENANGINAYQ